MLSSVTMAVLTVKAVIFLASFSVLHATPSSKVVEEVTEEQVQAEQEANGSIPAAPPEEPIGNCYDYIIVGAGSAGSVVANRLASSQKNYSVLVLESGGYPTRELYVPFNAPFSSNEYNSWQYFTVPQQNACLSFNEKKAPMTQGKVLGGTSSINSMNMVRGNAKDYDSWEKDYNASGWNYSSVLKYFMETESFMINDSRLTDVDKYHGRNGGTPVNYPNYYTNLSFVFLDACNESGYHYVDYNGKKKAGYSRTQCNTLNGARMSAYTCFLQMQSQIYKNLQVSTNSTATKIYFDEKKRATTVEFVKNGKAQNVTVGREVVVSAGAIGSAKLLMLSGIGPKQHLTELGINVTADLPVGDGLQDHVIFLGLMVTTTTDRIGLMDLSTGASLEQYTVNHTGLLALPGAYEAFLFTDSLTNETSPETPDIALALTAVFPSENISQSPYVSNWTYQEFYKPLITSNKTGFMTTITMVQPESRGTVKLNSTNASDPPLIDPRLLSVEGDITRTVKGILKVIDVFNKTKAMKNIGAQIWDKPLPYCKNHSVWSEDYLKCFLQYAGFPGMHVCCTCAMGNHTKSVVDNRLRVRNVTGIRVIDASVMPTITSGNTHAPVMMIGAKGAAMMLEDADAEEKEYLNKFQQNSKQ